MAPDLVERAEHLRNYAHSYADHGWAVFPFSPGQKIPALSKKKGGRGCLDATTNPEVIDRMWQRFPLANIGIATGPKRPASQCSTLTHATAAPRPSAT